ncbi:dynein light chain Tctex-type family protein [Aspergillus clavatus NRRL 1]|uniref:Dynein light chain (Tctex1), putative n=1 Tax=Aspergillus clavatus (strain ATCC 1007 / CBS 513.65 / DSM 816 / NCTC 3887 / NRRL 1 / QM 1276 / 107) TaxID=344612 RepID=A1CQF7_ASPCL|nr:dynein light chain (Tctex1), putative [Aspergillus clavatus NRRL 1]EAW07878.1 dynein light chain (Tctex1), putative [Aspergillus clavatus NRRL 1]
MAVEKGPVSPVPIPELTKIATEACDSALTSAEGYDHAKVGEWNSQIINTILKALIAATTSETPSTPPPYRFTVNSTIVQQGLIDKSSAADGAAGNAGKRGMHSASGAFWDVNRDGMWTFKYLGAEERGLDVVVSVTWFALG